MAAIFNKGLCNSHTIRFANAVISHSMNKVYSRVPGFFLFHLASYIIIIIIIWLLMSKSHFATAIYRNYYRTTQLAIN